MRSRATCSLNYLQLTEALIGGKKKRSDICNMICACNAMIAVKIKKNKKRSLSRVYKLAVATIESCSDFLAQLLVNNGGGGGVHFLNLAPRPPFMF